MNIVELSSKFEKKYESFLLQFSESLFYTSNKYRLLLKEFLETKDIYYIVIDEEENIIGALPTFLKETEIGNVLNSLPFYGSNGGVICENSNKEIKIDLINKFNELAKDENCISSTMVTSPFEKDSPIYEKNTKYTFLDSRIGQLTNLHELRASEYKDLLYAFNKKNRNSIRKAKKIGIEIENKGEKGLNFLIDTHKENIIKLGGIPKDDNFFNLVPKIFEENKDYRIFVATLDGIEIAALLLFYYNNTVEYFTPVVVNEFRNYQPISLLVFEAIKEAVKSYTWWNWGGTWISQKGVYEFKKSWGAIDMRYNYFNCVLNNEVFNYSKETILNKFPYFYVIPFERLIK